jgi:hypothetical protein
MGGTSDADCRTDLAALRRGERFPTGNGTAIERMRPIRSAAE